LSISAHVRIAPRPARAVIPTLQFTEAKAFRDVAAAVAPDGRPLAISAFERRRTVAQRSIEILIGRLITDEAFRSAFRGNAATALSGFIESGYELTLLEITALRATPVDLWARVADHVDPRLQKMSFNAD
jgi:hypothetical protein